MVVIRAHLIIKVRKLNRSIPYASRTTEVFRLIVNAYENTLMYVHQLKYLFICLHLKYLFY